MTDKDTQLGVWKKEYHHVCFKCGKEFVISHYIDTDKATCTPCYNELRGVKTYAEYKDFIG